MMRMKEIKKIFYFGIINWERIKQRPQHLARELSKDYEVIYLSPGYSWLDFILSKLKLTPKKVKLSFTKKITKINDNLVVIEPPTRIFNNRIFPLDTLNNLFLLMFTYKDLKKSDYIWFSYPTQYYIFSRFKGKKIYDIMDDYPQFIKNSPIKKHIAKLNEKLKNKGDLIICSSEDYKGKSNKEFCIPNAGDENVFSEKNVSDKDFLKEYRSQIGKRKIIGYIGYIGEWFDKELIYHASKKLEKTHVFVLVGPIHTSIEKSDNIITTGEVDYNLLPEYIKSFDYCIYPFIKNEITNFVNPVKIYEYIFMKKKVLAIDTQEIIDKFSKIIKVYHNENDFIQFLKEDFPLKIEQCSNFKKNNTWKVRAKEIKRLIRNSN